MFKKLFSSFLIFALISTQSYALEQQTEAAEFQVIFNDNVEVPASRIGERLWNAIPRAKRHFSKKVKKMRTEELQAYYKLYDVQNQEQLVARFEDQLVNEVPQMEKDILSMGLRAYKKKIKNQIREIEAQSRNGNPIQAKAKSQVDRKIASIGPVAGLVLVGLLAVITLLVVLHIIAVVILPLAVLAGLVILIANTSARYKCSPKRGCPATRNMVGYH